MISTNCDSGMIFLCQDKCSTVTTSKHNYLILGINDSQEKLGLIQTMSITSMKDKEVKMEVPIKLCNDMISYVVPYNLHSFLSSDIDIRNYKGCLKDTNIISKNDFMKLLIDIYTDSIGINSNHDEVVSRYNQYCDAFWEEYGYCKEYRDYEGEQKEAVIASPQISTPEIPNNQINSAYRKKSSYEKRRNKSKKKFIKNKEERYEKKEIQKIMRESTGKTEVNSKIKEDKVTEIPTSESFNILSRGDLTLEDMRRFNNKPRLISQWEDKDILDFIRGYKEFGFSRLHYMIPDRWKCHSSMSSCFSKCKEEATKRKLNISNIEYIIKPLKEWSDIELKNYLAIINNHKFDEDFQLEFTGFNNINQINQFTYKVKKEMSNRHLI